ncbi:MAG: acyl carrier protein [Planctomycetaceae bacterium]
MDPTNLAQSIRQLLEQVLAERDDAPRGALRSIDLHASFRDVGVNSVDLLEFVLRLEDSLEVRVLDDMLPEDLPSTLAQWIELVGARTRKAVA